MKKTKVYIVIGCVIAILVVIAAILIPNVFGKKEPDRSVRYEGPVQRFRGEVLFISKFENGYVIYMDQREHQPNSLMEFWIHERTALIDDQNGEILRKMLDEQQTGRTVLIGSTNPQDNILEGHSVCPVAFMYDKTPKDTSDNTENAGNTESTGSTENSESTGNTEGSENVAGNPGLTLLRFLEDTNSNGAVTPYDEPVPPGTLPEMWRIPQPDQSRIGETVPIVLAKWHRAIPFYYSCTEDGTERLAVFLSADKIPMLMVFETQLGGIAEFYKVINTGKEFQGKILAMVNISPEEGNIYAQNVGSSAYQVAAEEFLTDSTTLVAGECLGIVGETTFKHDKINMVVKGGVYESASQGLRENINWMKQRFARCGINELF